MGFTARELNVRRSCVRLVLLSACSTDGCKHWAIGMFALNLLSGASIVWCCSVGNTHGTVLVDTWQVVCFAIMLQTCW